ncbi:MAG: M20/M25/M40 family metallo-hydrolase [Proteobacteria bacterium]|nr:M20/M25/M40 family metallo-hydrolase [Pseudomonadota bacterium]
MGALAAAAIVVAGCVGGLVWFLCVMPGPRTREGSGAPTSDERALAERLRRHVAHLAASPRPATDVSAQARALAYIEAQLSDAGVGVKRQRTVADGSGLPNLVVRRDGTRADLPAIVVGAHYDSVEGSPGADDNASGVAALIELARLTADVRPARSIVFAFFSEEEVDMRGSRFLAADLRAGGVAVEAMLSLEMLGFYCDAPESQRYPVSMLSWIYPSRGDFVAFLGNLRSRRLTRTCVEAFRRTVAFPCEGLAAPDALRDVFRSDNASFWAEGFPAVMVTDTSNFRNPHYHKASDVPDTLAYDRLARVVLGLRGVLDRLVVP